MEFKSAVMEVWRNRQGKPLFTEQSVIMLMSRYQDQRDNTAIDYAYFKADLDNLTR